MKIKEIKKLIDVPKFIADIEAVVEQRQCSYIDAVTDYCESKDIDLDIAARIVRSNPAFKKRVQTNSVDLRMIK